MTWRERWAEMKRIYGGQKREVRLTAVGWNPGGWPAPQRQARELSWPDRFFFTVAMGSAWLISGRSAVERPDL